MDFAAALEWYAALASRQGWKEYVWRRVNEMAREHPAEFRDLPAQLTAEMKRRTSNENDPHPHD